MENMELEKVQPKDLDIQKPITNIFSNLESPFPNVYTNINVEKDPLLKPVILLTGFSGSGKDTVLNPLIESGDAFHIITAVARERRIEDGEPENAYIWMREKRSDESEEEYCDNLAKEYELIEYNTHYGDLYGLPLSSLKKGGSGIPVIRTDIHGVVTLHNVLANYGFQSISIGILPDSWEQIFKVISEREGENEQSAMKRIVEDVDSINMYKENINFFIHNSRKKNENGMSGLDQAIEAFRYLIKKYR
jgi:guanylate kinase